MGQGEADASDLETFATKRTLHEQRVGEDLVLLGHCGEARSAKSFEKAGHHHCNWRQHVATTYERPGKQKHVYSAVSFNDGEEGLAGVHLFHSTG